MDFAMLLRLMLILNSWAQAIFLHQSPRELGLLSYTIIAISTFMDLFPHFLKIVFLLMLCVHPCVRVCPCIKARGWLWIFSSVIFYLIIFYFHFFFNLFVLFCVWVFYLHVWMCTICMPSEEVRRGWVSWNWRYRRLWDMIWMLWTKPRSSAGTSDLTCPFLLFFEAQIHWELIFTGAHWLD